MNKRALMLTVAAVALAGSPAYAATVTGCDSTNTTDYTDITTKIAVPVCTLYANKGAAGNILIDTNGSVVVAAPTGSNPLLPAVTIDSSNIVTNKGTISFIGVTSAIGVQLNSDSGSGAISGALDSQGTINLTGAGESKIGILITTPSTPTGLTTTFTGVMPLPDANTAVTSNTAIDLEAGSVLEVQGDSSIGLELASGTSLSGDILLGGSIAVTPTTAGETAGTAGTDVEILGNMTGNLTVEAGSTVSASGPLAQGFLISGTLTGAFANYGSIEVIGTANPSTTATNATSGSALWIENNVTGGIYNAGGDIPNDTTTTTATIASNGQSTAPTIFIAPLSGATTPLTIGPVIDPDAVAVPSDSGFDLLNRGTITALAINPNVSTTAIRIAGAGPAVNVVMNGGILDAGTISATGTTTAASIANPIFVTAIDVDNYANVPSIVTSNESKNGTIVASASGAGEAVVSAILINSDGTVGGGHGTVTTITNAGTIEADAETTDTTVTTLEAFGINDIAGTVTTINNSGTISASATALPGNIQVAVAVDERGNQNRITFTDSGTVGGDVDFGTADDTFTVAATTTADGAKAQVTGNIDFGGTAATGDDTLIIGNPAVGAPDSVTGRVQEDGLADLVNVTIYKNATLDLLNDGTVNTSFGQTTNLRVDNMTVSTGATLDETVAQAFNMEAPIGGGNPTPVPVIQAPAGAAGITIQSDSTYGVNFGSFISATNSSGPSEFVLLDAPAGKLVIASPSEIVTDIGGGKIPFLFTGTVCGFNLQSQGFTGTGNTPDCAALTGVTNYEGTDSQLVLSLTPKNPTQLGLTGYAAKMFPLANAALASDNALGAAVINGVTSNATAQQIYSAFAPDVTGATRAEAISLTDQGTGPVGARQRALRMYAGQDGEATLWGQEFAQRLQVGNQVAAAGYDDSGFGFVLGMDAGDPADGRYGGAFTFYSGDADEKAPRDSKTTSQWYMLTGYTDWRGKGFFFDSQVNVGYGNLDGKRYFDFGGVSRVADGQRAAALLSGGATAGVAMTSGGTVLMPQISVDALTMREEGYTESNGGATASQADDGFDLHVHQEYAQSLRAFTGFDLRQDLNLGDFYLQPEARVGYRYDFVDGADKLRAEFACSTVTASATQTPCTAAPFSITGPDPARGNLVAGGSIATTTGAWSIGLSYDYLRGMGGANGKDTISQTGTLTLLGRI